MSFSTQALLLAVLAGCLLQALAKPAQDLNSLSGAGKKQVVEEGPAENCCCHGGCSGCSGCSCHGCSCDDDYYYSDASLEDHQLGAGRNEVDELDCSENCCCHGDCAGCSCNDDYGDVWHYVDYGFPYDDEHRGDPFDFKDPDEPSST